MAMVGKQPGAGAGAGAGASPSPGRAARPGPSLSLPIWCRHRTAVKVRRERERDSPREARRGLNAILRVSRRLGVGIEDLGRLQGARLLLAAASARSRKTRAAELRDPRSSLLTIVVAVLGAVLAGVLAAMLVADPDRTSDRFSNKSMGGLKQQQPLSSQAQPTEGDLPAYLLHALQTHRNHQHHDDDFILGYHDDYRERYDGFDQPPPFRQRVSPSTSPAARQEKRLSDVEISEEEAFSTRVFVTTPRRQR